MLSRKPQNVICFDFGDTLVSYALATEEGQLKLLADFWSAAERGALNGLEEATKVIDADLDGFCRKLNTERRDNVVWPFVDRIQDDAFLGNAISHDVAARLERELCAVVFETASIVDGARETLGKLKEFGCITGIMSNLPWGTSPTLWRGEILRHGFDASLVDFIVLCGDVGYRKPHPAGLNEIARALGQDAHRKHFVGDRESDVEAGKEAGWTPLLISGSHEGEQPLGCQSLADIREVVTTVLIKDPSV